MQICKVDVCTCIIGAERSAARSIGTNGQPSELRVYKKKNTQTLTYMRNTGHFEVRDVRPCWKKLPVLLFSQEWPTVEA